MATSKITITDTITQILDGTQVIDTLITFGTIPVAVCGGSTAGFTFLTGTPIGSGEKIIVPAGLVWNAICNTSKTSFVWITDFG